MRFLRRPPLDLHDADEVVGGGRRAGLGQERLGAVVGAGTREREEQDGADERREQREWRETDARRAAAHRRNPVTLPTEASELTESSEADDRTACAFVSDATAGLTRFTFGVMSTAATTAAAAAPPRAATQRERCWVRRARARSRSTTPVSPGGGGHVGRNDAGRVGRRRNVSRHDTGEQSVDEAGGRLRHRERAHGIARGADLGQDRAPLRRRLEARTRPRRARRASARRRGTRTARPRADRRTAAVELVHVARHAAPSVNMARSMRRPRCRRERTVPTGTPSASAICS